MAALTPRTRLQKTLSLPAPFRSAAPLALAAVVSLGLLATRAWPVAILASLSFAAAATVVAWRERLALERLRGSLDQTLLRPTRHQLSPLLVWRAGEVVEPAFREHVARETRRVVRMADGERLPG